MSEPDRLGQDKLALRASQAGMRFIAQMTIYNSKRGERLRQFIADSYHADLLEQQPVEDRLQAFEAMYEQVGGVKVKQVLAAAAHHVIVVLEAQRAEGLFYTEIKVEEDYPHQITFYMHQPLTPIGSGDAS